MIQRIQSIYLLFVAVFISALFFIPSAVFDDGALNLTNLLATGLQKHTDTGIVAVNTDYIFAILAIANIALALYTILLFKNRQGQIRMCYAIIVLLTVLFIYIIVNILIIKSSHLYTSLTFGKGLVAPVFSIFAAFMSIRGIKKDEELVKSADRLR